MKKLLLFLCVLSFLTNTGCDECRDVSCFTPPAPLLIRLTNADSGEDWLKSNSIDPEKLQIYSFTENTTHLIDILDQDSFYVFRDVEIGWETGMARDKYELRLDTLMLPFEYHTENVTEDCCGFFETIKIEVNSSSVVDFQQNLITFKIEP